MALTPPGGPNPVPRLVQLFLGDSQRRIGRLREAFERGDAAEVQRLAHAQKGSSETIGARELGALAAELDSLGRLGTLDGGAAVLGRLETAFADARQALERYCEPEPR
jgi:HPt (histidine-containing phosphotransfer) domain-containing protein